MKKSILTIILSVGSIISWAYMAFEPEESGKVMLQNKGSDTIFDQSLDTPSISKEGPMHIGATGSTIYGFMSYLDREDYLNGWYEIQPSGALTRLWQYPYADYGVSMTNGWMRDGKLCGLCTLNIGGEDLISLYAYQELDPSTGQLLVSRPIDISESFMPYFYTAAYIPSDNMIYGFGKGEDKQSTVYYFKKAPADRPEDAVMVKELEMPGDRCYSLCYSIADGCLYGVNTRGILVKILTDGTITELFELPVYKLANGNGALTVSPYDGYLLWNPSVYIASSELYAIYPSEQRMEKLYHFPEDCQFTFFLSPDGPTDASGPAASQLISVSFENASLNGQIIFKLPSSAMDASPIAGSLDWTLFDNGTVIANGSGDAGSDVSVPVSAMQGEHTFRVETNFGSNSGYPLSFFKYVGYDTPMSPENVTLTTDMVKWDAVTGGVHGGYINPDEITYKVYLNDNFQGEVSDTYLNLEIDPEMIQDAYRAKVIAVGENLESDPGISEKQVIGRSFSLPMTIEPTEHDAELVTIINADGSPDYGTWRLSDAWGDLCFASGWSYEPADDWLIMPAASFDSNEVVYQVSLDAARGGYTGALEYFEVWAGDAPTVEAMTIPVIPKTRAQKFNEWKEYSGKFAIPRPGAYYIAVRGCSEPDQKDLIVRNIRISATDSPAAVPSSVEGFEVISASDANLTATLKYRMPDSYINGEAIPADKELTVRINSAEETNVMGYAGSEHTVTVPTVQGENYITATPIADGLEGTAAEVSVFTGMDYLSYCENFKGIVSRDNMSIRLTWSAPQESLNGGYFNTTGIEYMIGEINSLGEFLDTPVSAGIDVGEYNFTLPEDAPLKYMRIGIAAKNAAGISPARSFVGRVLGTPYTLPMEEDFENMELHYSPLQASAPSSKYENGSWTWCQPELVDPAYLNEEIPYGIIGYTDNPEAWVRMGLPKFSTVGLQNAHALFKIWNGSGTATQKSIYATLYDMSAPEKIADIPVGDGWEDIIVNIPSKYLDQPWASLYIDGCLPSAENYFILGGYEIMPTSGVSTTYDGVSAISRNGSTLNIKNPASNNVKVMTLNGIILYNGNDYELSIRLPGKGIYLVKAGLNTYKIVY